MSSERHRLRGSAPVVRADDPRESTTAGSPLLTRRRPLTRAADRSRYRWRRRRSPADGLLELATARGRELLAAQTA